MTYKKDKNQNQNKKDSSSSTHGNEHKGLGSPNMSEETKHRIHSEGGKASHSSGRKGHE